MFIIKQGTVYNGAQFLLPINRIYQVVHDYFLVVTPVKSPQNTDFAQMLQNERDKELYYVFSFCNNQSISNGG
jgi:hypothetical protein